MLNVQEVLKRVIKYLVEGLMVAIACYAIQRHPSSLTRLA